MIWSLTLLHPKQNQNLIYLRAPRFLKTVTRVLNRRKRVPTLVLFHINPSHSPIHTIQNVLDRGSSKACFNVISSILVFYQKLGHKTCFISPPPAHTVTAKSSSNTTVTSHSPSLTWLLHPTPRTTVLCNCII